VARDRYDGVLTGVVAPGRGDLAEFAFAADPTGLPAVRIVVSLGPEYGSLVFTGRVP
jgi:hypothetical protein